MKTYQPIMGLAVLLAFGLCSCSEAPTPPEGPAQIVTQGPIRFGVVADNGDSLDIEIRFAVSDTAELDHINWENVGFAPVQPLVIGSTAPATATLDTVQLRKPAPGATDGYEMRAQGVDTLANVGPFSAPQPWFITHLDTVGPPPPQQIDPVPGDTIIVTSTLEIAVWPDSSEIAELEEVQYYAAKLHSDAIARCDIPAPVPGALYESGTFPGGCDSALAKLVGVLETKPALVRSVLDRPPPPLPESALRYASWLPDRSDPFLWPARRIGGG